MNTVAYRFRIRSLDDTTDDYTFTSVRDGTNPYIAAPPSGDGASFDRLTGKPTTGSYTIQINDALTDTNTRVVTSMLADAAAKWQVLSRKAFIDIDRGQGWSVLIAGYVNAVRLPNAITATFAIGDTQRIELNRDLFKSVTTRFGNVTTIIGGPVLSNWGPLRSYGGWRVIVNQVHTSPDYVQLKLIRGFDPRKYNGTFSTTSTAITDYTNSIARPYFQEADTWKGVNIMGSFPGLAYRTVSVADTSDVAEHLPIADPQRFVVGIATSNDDNLMRNGESSFWMQWTGTTPSVGDLFDLFLYVKDIGPDNPLHIYGHPVDIWEQLHLDAGIPYNTSALATVKARLGADLRFAGRITASSKMSDWLVASLYGPFGLTAYTNSNGERTLVSTRVRLDTLPSTTLTMADLRSKDTVIFDLDEQTIVNRVTLKQQIAKVWTTKEVGQPEVDGLYTNTKTVTVELDEDLSNGLPAREQVYDLPGFLQTSSTTSDPDKYTLGLGAETLDRCGRGAAVAELACLPNVGVQLGDEFILNVPHQVNPVVGQSPVSQRGGQRIVQVTGRTETPAGPVLKIQDSGTTAQPSLAPTFTLATSATDSRRYVDVAITNAASLVANGVTAVRIEVAFGSASPTSGTMHTILDPNVTTATQIRADAGSLVAVRMRSEKAGLRPSSFTAWDSEQLDALDAVTSLAVSTEDTTDVSRRLLTWVCGTNAGDIPIEIITRVDGDPTDTAAVIAYLPAGSTQYELRGLETGDLVVIVRHKELAPYAGVSPDETVTVTTSAGGITLPPPLYPEGFSGSLDPNGALVVDGTYGLEVTAAFVPSLIEFSAKPASSGSFEVVTIVPAVVDGPTRFIDRAPNDGDARLIRARHVGDAVTPSPYTPETSVLPWSPTPIMPTSPIQLDVEILGPFSDGLRLLISSRYRGTFKVYVFRGSLITARYATVNDTLLGTSAAGQFSYAVTDGTPPNSTGRTGCLVVQTAADGTILAVLNDIYGPILSFPGVTNANITAVALSGDAYQAYAELDPVEAMVGTVTYDHATSGSYVHVSASLDNVTYSDPIVNSALTSGAHFPLPVSIDLRWTSIGPLFLKYEIRDTSSPTSTLRSSFIVATETGYRGWWDAA